MNKELFLKNKNTDIYVREKGSGPVLLMVHGSACDSSFYDEAEESLSENFRVITFDRRGYGRSNQYPTDNFSLEIQVEDIRMILEYIGEPIILFAHSAGCAVSAKFAIRYSEWVSKLILFEPFEESSVVENSIEAVWIQAIVELIRKEQYSLAMIRFSELMGDGDPESPPPTIREQEYMMTNYFHFIKNEFFHIFCSKVPYDKMDKDRTIFACSKGSYGNIFWKGIQKICEKTPFQVVGFPGYHNCPRDHASEFSKILKCCLGYE